MGRCLIAATLFCVSQLANASGAVLVVQYPDGAESEGVDQTLVLQSPYEAFRSSGFPSSVTISVAATAGTTGANSGDFWLHFTAGAEIVAGGVYEHDTGSSLLLHDWGTLNCSDPFRVEVMEFELGPPQNISGAETIVRLAMDFEQDCGAEQPLRGSIRINSDLPLSGLAARPLLQPLGVFHQGQPVTSQVLLPSELQVQSGTWRQLSGPPVIDLAASGTADTLLTFTTPDVPKGGETIILEYAAVDESEGEQKEQTWVVVMDTDDPVDSFYVTGSGLNDPFGASAIELNQPWFSMLTANFGAAALEMDFLASGRWQFEFDAGEGNSISPGNFSNTRGSENGDSSLPYFSVQRAFGSGCDGTLSGELLIHSYEVSSEYGDGSIDIEFDQTCDATGERIAGRLVYTDTTAVNEKPHAMTSKGTQHKGAPPRGKGNLHRNLRVIDEQRGHQ